MAGLLARGAAFLAGPAFRAGAVLVTYARAGQDYPMTAVPGRQTAASDGRQDGRLVVDSRGREYVLLAADLEAAGLGTPLAGDTVTETVRGVTTVHQVPRDKDGAPGWVWADADRLTIAIRCVPA